MECAPCILRERKAVPAVVCQNTACLLRQCFLQPGWLQGGACGGQQTNVCVPYKDPHDTP